MSTKKPITIITGFLGSGKTSVLNHLLSDENFADTAVIINEFGEVGIDHLLVDTSFEEDEIVVMQSGCICCTIRGDLVDTLADLEARNKNGDLPPFKRVLVETTGLADPAPILQTVMSDPLLVDKYCLGGVVATVDAVNGRGTFETYPEAIKQAAVSDRLLLTKTDITDNKTVANMEKHLVLLNPNAPVEHVVNGSVSPERIFGLGLYDVGGKTESVTEWLSEANEIIHEHEHHNHSQSNEDQKLNRHTSDIITFCLTRSEPLPWEGVKAWLESIVSLCGENLLRVKGVINIAEYDAPVVIHGVQHVFHPPIRLNAWPDKDHSTRIVFITRNISEKGLEKSLTTFCLNNQNSMLDKGDAV
ncbi:MAG: GTP-binding protein [Rhodospirillaceae bacterium]|nr:GTP-binding protein [Rhodospirillaceae bacterium]|tara:strand:- start:7547 stop:8626 length:1080 start_codon:yes stop_codon:yes gene_type:complete